MNTHGERIRQGKLREYWRSAIFFSRLLQLFRDMPKDSEFRARTTGDSRLYREVPDAPTRR